MLKLIVFAILVTRMYCHTDQWRHNVLYYDPQNLTCDTRPSPDVNMTDPGRAILWLIPNGQILKPGDVHDRVEISPDGHWLNVKRVDDADFGVYNCLVFKNGVLALNFRKGINVDGAFWGDLMKKYAPRAVVGAISAAVAFAVASVLCICYGRHQSRGQERFEAHEAMMLHVDGHQNDGYNMEDVSEIKVPEKCGIELPPIVTQF